MGVLLSMLRNTADEDIFIDFQSNVLALVMYIQRALSHCVCFHPHERMSLYGMACGVDGMGWLWWLSLLRFHNFVLFYFILFILMFIFYFLFLCVFLVCLFVCLCW